MPSIPDKIWIDQADLDALPTSGQAWDEMKSWADANWGSDNLVEGSTGPLATAAEDTPTCGTETSYGDNHVLAFAIAHMKDPNGRATSTYLDELKYGIENVILSEITAPTAKMETYNIGRNLGGYIVAADMVDLKTIDTPLHNKFKGWLRYVREELIYERHAGGEVYRVRSVTDMVRNRPNNHGSSGEHTLTALNMYLGDMNEIEASAERYRAFVGEPGASNPVYKYKKLGTGTFQADPANPVGLNRQGATIVWNSVARDVDGMPPEEARRTANNGGNFAWPPGVTNYFWSFAAPFLGWVHLLNRCGYPVLSYGDNAVQRFFTWCDTHLWITSDGNGDPNLEDLTPVAAGQGDKYFPGASNIYHLQDDIDTIFLANNILGTSYPTNYIDPKYFGKPGKSMGHNYYLFPGA